MLNTVDHDEARHLLYTFSCNGGCRDEDYLGARGDAARQVRQKDQSGLVEFDEFQQLSTGLEATMGLDLAAGAREHN